MPYLIPIVLSVVAVLVGGLGTRLAHKSRRPTLFRIGALFAAAGFMLLWLLPWWAISYDAGAWAMPLFVATLVIAVSVLGGGLSAMARAATGREDTQADRIIQDLSHLNDWP